MEASLVQRANIPFKAIPAAGVHGVGLRRLPRNILQLIRGMFAARKVVNDFQPEVLLFTGGYVAVPMALAARKIPALVYIPDIEPGMALKFLLRFADIAGVTSPATRRYLPAGLKSVVTGYPTRPELTRWQKAQAREQLGLQEDLPTLLVFGGSKGARSINHALHKHLAQLLMQCQIVHITGELDWHHPYPYLHEEMGAALASADLVIARAGASTLGEFPLFELPAILVPYPYAWRYQRTNAETLTQGGAALMVEDARLSEELGSLVASLLSDPQRLEKMRNAMRSLARPQAAENLADLVRSLAASSSPTGGHA
jgi:UDP-N-acetylglucosamine--N-acetylmuramyl-(pentapeptide) pyrophosphoryl-undecaprenol N-acetylglucosamine transferase